MSHRILAIDASTEACSAAVLDGDKLISRFEVAPREHAKRLLPMVDEVMQQAGLKLNQLDAIAFGRGPGSFTGVRIGIGVAQGLAFGAGLKMVGVSTLEAMTLAAHQQHGARQVVAAIDARMAEVYVAAYQIDGDGSVSVAVQEQVSAPEQFATSQQLPGDWHAVGTGWETYPDQMATCADNISILDQPRLPAAAQMTQLGARDLAAGLAVPPDQVEPVYLRDKVAWKKMPGRE